MFSVDSDDFVRIGTGDFGGKARSLQFIKSLLKSSDFNKIFYPNKILIPQSYIIGSDYFVEFIEKNKLFKYITSDDDTEIKKQFLKAKIPKSLREKLKELLKSIKFPIVIRSSSLFEDAFNYSMAGLFKSILLPNNNKKFSYRLKNLKDAIKLIYASAFLYDPKNFMKSHNLPIENERMGIIIQKATGVSHGFLFYPHVSAVAQSINFFPISYLKPEDGIVLIGVGLGNRIVKGGEAVRFSPRNPYIRPQFSTIQDILANYQKTFLALNLNFNKKNLSPDRDETLVNVPIEDLPRDEFNYLLLSTYVPEDMMIYDDTYRCGMKIPTFNKLLSDSNIRLCQMIQFLFEEFKRVYNSHILFKFDMKFTKREGKTSADIFISMVRPITPQESAEEFSFDKLPPESIIAKTKKALGSGIKKGVKHIVFVEPSQFNYQKALIFAQHIADINSYAAKRNEKIILMGPGRFGTVNHHLGIPVSFAQINSSAAIVEIATRYFKVDPSQGTHFFQNVVNGGIFYFSLDLSRDDYLNVDFIKNHKNSREIYSGLWWLQLDDTSDFEVIVNGKTRQGIIFINKV